MIRIRPATPADVSLLAALGRQTFIESHGNSASAADIDHYVAGKYTEAIIGAELEEPGNRYHLVCYRDQAAGYSKIVLSCSHPDISLPDVTKLERLYLLRSFYGLGLGEALLEHNLQLSVNMGQRGMWLYVWTENHRAVAFYQKNGFRIKGSHDFAISPAHSNPNHHMLLEYGVK